MSTDSPDHRPSLKRKPIWPWLALLVVTLMVIYAYNEALAMFDDQGHTGRDFVQLFKWLLSIVEGEVAGTLRVANIHIWSSASSGDWPRS
jgi:hypothetical protein